MYTYITHVYMYCVCYIKHGIIKHNPIIQTPPNQPVNITNMLCIASSGYSRI